MAVYLRRGKWVVDIWPQGRRGKRKRITLPVSVKTEQQARVIEQSWLQMTDKAKRQQAAASNVGVWDLYERYEAEQVNVYMARRTADDVRAVFLNHLLPHFGRVAVTALSDADVRSYVAKRKGTAKMLAGRALRKARSAKASVHGTKPVSERCINKELAYFSAFLSWCEGQQIAFVRPRFQKFKVRRPIPVVLSVDEAVRFLLAAEPPWRAYFGALYMMGLRASEAKGLTWADIDGANQTAIIRGKGGKFRIVPIPAWLMGAIEAIRPEEPSGPVFRSLHGAPVANSRRAIERARAKAGIQKRIHPHLLRHSYATHLLELNTNLRRIQELLGHSQIAVTEWYTHVAAAHLKGTSDALNAAFSEHLPVDTAVDKGRAKVLAHKGKQRKLLTS